MANFEWTAGFGNRYWIRYVDFKDAKVNAENSREAFRARARNAMALEALPTS